MEKWNDSIDSEGSANYFLSRIIWRRVDQTVTKLYKENDPVFDKILKIENLFRPPLPQGRLPGVSGQGQQ